MERVGTEERAMLTDRPEPTSGLEAQLERGEVVFYPACPFPVATGQDHGFLLEQRLGGRVHKNISYDPHTGKANGFARQSGEQAERLRKLLAAFADNVTTWLTRTLPGYAVSWRRDRVSYRPEEEATRVLRQKARNDLLHVDAFPSRPTNGWRILRVFVNVNPTEDRVWVTSDPFAKLFQRFGVQAGLPSRSDLGFASHVSRQFLRLFRPGQVRRSPYDAFMLRFHDFLKANDEFQEKGPKRFWRFPPGSCWMCFTDTTSHAVLRGRFALEHSYFVNPASLVLPEEAPATILERACGMAVLNRAA
jgi:hypothetical protein